VGLVTERRLSNTPDASEAAEQYGRAAPGYDRHMRRFAPWQGKAVDRLDLRPGNAVVDVACGTGLNFPLLQARVGAGGRILGIDLSSDMIAIARERVASHGWHNVTLIEAAVEEAQIQIAADAALFSFAHDVLQSSKAVANVVAHLQPGARVSSVGAKFAKGWNPVVNFFVRRSARPYVTTFRGLDRPWRELERYAGEMQSEALALGGAYVAWGRVGTEGIGRAAGQLA
jgi:ubiquinone/menaquinone biosynthesis C-methylase UbiE